MNSTYPIYFFFTVNALFNRHNFSLALGFKDDISEREGEQLELRAGPGQDPPETHRNPAHRIDSYLYPLHSADISLYIISDIDM